MAFVKEEVTITRTVSHMRDSDMRKLLQQQANKEFYVPNRAPLKLTRGIDEFRDHVLQKIGDVPINYLEFGVAYGESLGSMMSRFSHPDSQFFGFDSFEGLPEAWHPNEEADVKVGGFTTNGNLPVIKDGRAEFFKGWFQNTLPPFLATHRVGCPRAHLVHYDADLYSSTLFILCTLWHHLPEYSLWTSFHLTKWWRSVILPIHTLWRLGS